MTEAKRNSLKRLIKHYRAVLNEEKRKYGGYDDSRGLRYAIAELYLRLEDFAGASRYYNLFAKRFADDASYPYFKFGWARSKFEMKKYDIVRLKIVEMSRDNTYLLDLITNNETASIDKYEWTRHETFDSALETLPDYLKLLNPSFTAW